jgi:hypothetical protein
MGRGVRDAERFGVNLYWGNKKRGPVGSRLSYLGIYLL